MAGYFSWPKAASHSASADTSTKQAGTATAPNVTDPAVSGPLPGVLAGRNAFLPLVKSEFKIVSSVDSRAAVCRLVEVGDEMMTTAPTARYASFSLLFSASKDFVGEGNLYRLTHPQMKPMDVFLSPVGRSEKQVFLEAVFSERV